MKEYKVVRRCTGTADVFVFADTEEEALEKARKEHLYEEQYSLESWIDESTLEEVAPRAAGPGGGFVLFGR